MSLRTARSVAASARRNRAATSRPNGVSRAPPPRSPPCAVSTTARRKSALVASTSSHARRYDIPSDLAAAVMLPVAPIASSNATFPGPRRLVGSKSMRSVSRVIRARVRVPAAFSRCAAASATGPKAPSRSSDPIRRLLAAAGRDTKLADRGVPQEGRRNVGRRPPLAWPRWADTWASRRLPIELVRVQEPSHFWHNGRAAIYSVGNIEVEALCDAARAIGSGGMTDIRLRTGMAEVHIDFGGHAIVCAVTRNSAERRALGVGDQVRAVIKPMESSTRRRTAIAETQRSLSATRPAPTKGNSASIAGTGRRSRPTSARSASWCLTRSDPRGGCGG